MKIIVTLTKIEHNQIKYCLDAQSSVAVVGHKDTGAKLNATGVDLNAVKLTETDVNITFFPSRDRFTEVQRQEITQTLLDSVNFALPLTWKTDISD